MKTICTLCNGIEERIEKCSHCEGAMVDKGAIVDYLDDYSPYLSNDISGLVDGAEEDECIHLFQCENCEYDKRIKINRVEI